jgi:hypothetical protein
MRLPLLAPASLSSDQKDLYDDMVDVIEKNFGELVARRKDGALIGPFNGWLHFPQFGKPAWAFNRAMWEHSVPPGAIHQLVILTAAKFGARYEIYGHRPVEGPCLWGGRRLLPPWRAPSGQEQQESQRVIAALALALLGLMLAVLGIGWGLAKMLG